MKKLIVLLVLVGLIWKARAQETLQFALTLAATNNANDVAGSGTFLLVGNHMAYEVLDAPPPIIVRGPAGPGTNAPILFRLDGGCGVDSGCSYSGERDLTAEEVTQLRSGLWYAEAAGAYRGQIELFCASHFTETNAIEFTAFLSGDNPNRSPRFIRWGRVTGWLNDHNFSYRMLLPAAYGPYQAYVVQTTADGRPGGKIVYNLGTLSCAAISSNLPPDASGLEPLPQCAAQGSLCVSDHVLPTLLGGGLAFGVFPGLVLRGNPAQGALLPVDSDQDGVPDYLDHCPNTATNSVINADGCSIADLCPCDGPWRNHGEYVNCLKSVTAQFVSDGLITEAQRRSLLVQAAQSSCGKAR